ncbi:hypothetical protein CFP56_006216 [Quercus suber]|uniref:Uncharacterized protein n=1 Tax=Quercus suber TaxID=58331 RepID=A0AAW0LAI5_QUESU
MGGFSVVEEATAAVGKREYGDTWGNPLFHSQHRRSKSASDRNASVLGGGVLRSIKRDQDETYVRSQWQTMTMLKIIDEHSLKLYIIIWNVLPYSASVSRGQSPLHDYANHFNKNISSNHRASLEKDVSIRTVLYFSLH